MIGSRFLPPRRSTDEGEKPFWISFADLMTALMVLFMVVMVIALLSVTQQLRDAAKDSVEREQDIAKIKSMLGLEVENFPGIKINFKNWTIDFGEAARFQSGSWELSPEAQESIRRFVPVLLNVADTKEGKKWFKSIVVQGFTDTDGAYLLNLNLSLQRAQSVVCGLLAEPGSKAALSPEQQAHVRKLFMVGGFSFNSAKVSKDESRRVELRIDLRASGEAKSAEATSSLLDTIETGKCLLP